jgi:hypothetical protein
MMLRRPAGGNAAVELAREAPLGGAARAAACSPVPKHAVPRALGSAFRASWSRESGLPAGTRRRRYAPAGIAGKTGDRCVPV